MSAATGSSGERFVLAFREGVAITRKGDVAAVESPHHSVSLQRLAPGLLAALERLSAGGASAEEIAAAAEARAGAAALPVLFYYLERFNALGLLDYSAAAEGTKLATLERAADGRPMFAPELPAPADAVFEYELSRFACIRRLGGALVVESPLSHARVVLHDARALLLCHALAARRSVAQLAEVCPAAGAVLGLLVACRAAAAVQPGGEAVELSLWSFHDLLFHSRSRLGRNPEPLGATFRFAEKIPPLPALKPPMSGARIALLRPDVASLTARDVPFTRVVEERRSIHDYGRRPIDVRQLGELLYRAARVRALRNSSSTPSYPASSRPYAGGGACYELEIYPVVRACEGLAEGLYHYDPGEHALTMLSGPTAAVAALLAGARGAMMAPEPPQVLLVLGARFGRVMWKYESTAYAIILKDAGALMQTLYLTATAMRLAPCALGAGDADLFAAAAGLDYLAETSVAEMALGSLPSETSSPET